MTRKTLAVALMVVVFSVATSAFANVVDLGTMKRSEVITAIFGNNKTTESQEGLCVSGQFVQNTTFKLGKAVVSVNWADKATGAIGTAYGTSVQTDMPHEFTSGGDTHGSVWFKTTSDSESRQPKTFAVKTVEELMKLAGATYVDGTDNSMIKVSLIEANGYVQGDVLDVQFAGKYDSSEGLDKALPAKVTAFTEITVKDFAKAEPAPKEVKEYGKDELVTADDVLRIFGGVKGDKGEVKEVPIPAHTRFTVHEAWACVSLWDSTQAPADYIVETGSQEQKVTFWPNPEYWQTKNTIAITATEIEKVFEIGEPVVEGSVWQTVVAKAEMAGKTLSLDATLTAVTIKGDGVVLETPVITVPAAGAETAADVDDVIRICKKADLEAADYTTLNGIRKASPVTVEVENKGEGSNAVKFYLALASWKPALGANLFEVSVDPTHVDTKDGVYTSKDGYHIAFVTAWLKNVADADKKAAADTGNGGGSGGGGCNGGYGAIALALLPLFALKKGRK